MSVPATSVLVRQGEIAIRRMQDTLPDYAQMAKWLTDERVLVFFEGRDNPHPLEHVIAHYSPRALGAEQVVPCFVLYQEQPVGYIQYYPLTEADQEAYRLNDDEMASRMYGIDMFIGEPELWGQGIGTRALVALNTYLIDSLGAERLVIDPHVVNTRAVRAYEKAGFSKVRILPAHELHEGEYRDSWLMIIDARPRNSQRARPEVE